jgi:hypothetical protein
MSSSAEDEEEQRLNHVLYPALLFEHTTRSYN